jgi:hypothetical protein
MIVGKEEPIILQGLVERLVERIEPRCQGQLFVVRPQVAGGNASVICLRHWSSSGKRCECPTE